MNIEFALIREGTSDDGLVQHLRTLILAAGAAQAIGATREYKGSTEERIEQVLREESEIDLIFVHRDADGRDPAPRHTEVSEAANTLGCQDRVVSIVPVQELEAWLLADEASIRRVAGKPKGKIPLAIPPTNSIEKCSSPKEVLEAALLAASETRGARYKKAKSQFSRNRATLLERLDHDGPVSQIPSWQRFVADVTERTQQLLRIG